MLLLEKKITKFKNRTTLYFARHTKIVFMKNVIVDHQMALIFLKIQQKEWKLYSKQTDLKKD